MDKQEIIEAIGPIINQHDFSVWHAVPGGKAYQLGIHVCRKGTTEVDYIRRTITVSRESYALIKSGDLDAQASFDGDCDEAKKELHELIINTYESLDNIDLVATSEGYTGVLN
jgi:hypothetical protein